MNESPVGTREQYAEWIYQDVFLDRGVAEPDGLLRAIRILTATLSQIGDVVARGRIVLRILSDANMLAAIRADETLWASLQSVLDNNRVIAGLVFDQQEYIDAVHRADRGLSAQIRDRSDVAYELRTVGMLSNRMDGIGIFREESLVGFDSDWRRRIPYADDESLRNLMLSNRQWLELSELELSGLTERLREASPAQRNGILDQWIHGLAHIHLSTLKRRLASHIHPQELVPMHTSSLARYAGVDDDAEIDLDRITERLLSRCHPFEVFQRLSGVPIRMSDRVVDACIELCESPEAFFHTALKRIGTPLTRLHLLSAASHWFAGKKRARLVRRLFLAVVQDLVSLETPRFVNWARWTMDELLRGAESATWTARKRAFVGWIYANQSARLLIGSGNGLERSLDVRKALDCHDDLLYGDGDGLSVLLNVNNISIEKLLLGAVSDAFDLEAPPAEFKAVLLALFENDSSDVPWKAGLYTPSDGFPSWLSVSPVDALRDCLGDMFSEETAPSFEPGYADGLLNGLTVEQLPLVYSAFLLGGGDAAIAYARAEIARAEPFDSVTSESPGWRLRLLLILRICVISGTDQDVEAAAGYFRGLVTVLARESALDADHVMALIEAGGTLAHRAANDAARVSSFASSLVFIAEASPALSRMVGPIAQRLLKRLPASWLNENITKVALLSRFRATMF
jgi:hypothetical protein